MPSFHHLSSIAYALLYYDCYADSYFLPYSDQIITSPLLKQERERTRSVKPRSWYALVLRIVIFVTI